ncbi:MAG: hypothetical protein ACI81T_002104 [Bacteroidia bacterium]|jgi:hypothetical protein
MERINPKNIDDKLLLYLEGGLSLSERMELERQLEKDLELHKKLDEFRTVLEGFSSQEIEVPKAVSENFFQLLETEQGKVPAVSNQKAKRFELKWWMQAAAAILIFATGFLVDKQIEVGNIRDSEIAKLKEEMTTTKNLMMLSMLKQSSASGRIQAVNQSYQVKDAGKELVNALIETMNYDASLNVRMASAEALYRFAESSESVKMAMVHSLRLQDEPDIQILLIDMLVELEAEEALGIFQSLMEKEDLLEIVKMKAGEAVEKFI